MTAPLLHTCEGTDGVAITTSNAPAGSNNWGSIVVAASALAEYDTDQFMHGASSIRFASPTTGADRAMLKWDTVTSQVVVRTYLRFSALPTSQQIIVNLLATGSVTQASVRLSTGGVLQLQDSTATTVSGPTLSLDTWYRVELLFDSTGAQLIMRTYLGDSLTPLATTTYTSPTISTLAFTYFGKCSQSGTIASFWMDSLKVGLDALTWIGPEITTLMDFTACTQTGGTATGGTAIAVLSDDDDATYLTSPDNPSSWTVDLTLPAIQAPSGDLYVAIRANYITASGGSIVATLRDGSTTVATAPTVSLGGTVSTSWAVFPAASLTGLTSGQWAAGTLVVRLSITAAA